MRKDIAQKLVFLVNDKELFKALLDYIQERIEAHRDYLENGAFSIDHERGAIFELRRFKTLRDEVLEAIGKPE